MAHFLLGSLLSNDRAWLLLSIFDALCTAPYFHLFCWMSSTQNFQTVVAVFACYCCTATIGRSSTRTNAILMKVMWHRQLSRYLQAPAKTMEDVYFSDKPIIRQNHDPFVISNRCYLKMSLTSWRDCFCALYVFEKLLEALISLFNQCCWTQKIRIIWKSI